MLQNAYFLAKIGADTAENEQHFVDILPKISNYRYHELPGRCPGGRPGALPLRRGVRARGRDVLRRPHLRGRGRQPMFFLTNFEVTFGMTFG